MATCGHPSCSEKGDKKCRYHTATHHHHHHHHHHRFILTRPAAAAGHSRCGVEVYCSKAHQVEDWKRHKKECQSKAEIATRRNVMTIGTKSRTAMGDQIGFAAYNGDIVTVKQLLKKGAPTNAASSVDGATALYAAAAGEGLPGRKSYHVEIIELLVAKDRSTLDQPKTTGACDTPLMGASGIGKLDRVKMLVRLGANLFAEGAGGATALDFAEKSFYGQSHMYESNGRDETVVSFLKAEMDKQTREVGK